MGHWVPVARSFLLSPAYQSLELFSVMVMREMLNINRAGPQVATNKLTAS
jgi:hypothetical protein